MMKNFDDQFAVQEKNSNSIKSSDRACFGVNI